MSQLRIKWAIRDEVVLRLNVLRLAHNTVPHALRDAVGRANPQHDGKAGPTELELDHRARVLQPTQEPGLDALLLLDAHKRGQGRVIFTVIQLLLSTPPQTMPMDDLSLRTLVADLEVNDLSTEWRWPLSRRMFGSLQTLVI